MALITPSYVKPFLNIELADSTYEAQFTAWIEEASAVIAKHCRQTIELVVRTDERFDGNGAERYTFPGFPISSVSALERRSSGLGTSSTWEEIEVDEWEFVDANGYYIYYPSRFQRGTLNYRVTYSVGYSEIPADIKRVCREMVAEIYMQSPIGKSRFGVSSISKGDSPHTITETFLNMNPQWVQLLRPYRRTMI